MLVQGFCPLKIKITQFPGGFHLNSPVEPEGDSLLKMTGMPFISLRGVNNCPNCTPGGRALIFSWRGGGSVDAKGESLRF